MAKSVETLNKELNMTGAEYIATCDGVKSKAIRKLAGEGMSKGDIARYLDIRFQHVRNVLVTPLKKS